MISQVRKGKKMVPSRGRSTAEASVLDTRISLKKRVWLGWREKAGWGPRVAVEVGCGGLPHWILQVSGRGRENKKVLSLTQE